MNIVKFVKDETVNIDINYCILVYIKYKDRPFKQRIDNMTNYIKVITDKSILGQRKFICCKQNIINDNIIYGNIGIYEGYFVKLLVFNNEKIRNRYIDFIKTRNNVKYDTLKNYIEYNKQYDDEYQFRKDYFNRIDNMI